MVFSRIEAQSVEMFLIRKMIDGQRSVESGQIAKQVAAVWLTPERQTHNSFVKSFTEYDLNDT